ncbi:MAG: 3-deoxy-7-phosphoheptulonate synthase [Pseudonocardiales bacterium]|nr:3-deoxy-7-phosphoheptulonate synthase [Pseudonocardiales bacterium]
MRRAGHPVVWVSDPMHGNTVRSDLGLKTRQVSDVTAEALAFRSILKVSARTRRGCTWRWRYPRSPNASGARCVRRCSRSATPRCAIRG